MPPAARLGDPSVHGGVLVMGYPTVLIGNKPAARVGDNHTCPMVTGTVPHVGGPLVMGAFNVLVGGPFQSRQGDTEICVGPPDSVAMGEPTVLVDTQGGGGLGGALGAIIGGVLASLANAMGQGPRAVLQPDGTWATQYNRGILIRGDPQFQANAIRDLDRINSTPSGRARLESIANSGRTVTIVPPNHNAGTQSDYDTYGDHCRPADGNGHVRMTPDPAGTDVANLGHGPERVRTAGNGPGTDSTIVYAPDTWPSAQNPGTPPDVVLGHELTHAEHNAYGRNTQAMTDPDPSWNAAWTNREESATVGQENIYRAERGGDPPGPPPPPPLPQRQDYAHLP